MKHRPRHPPPQPFLPQLRVLKRSHRLPSPIGDANPRSLPRTARPRTAGQGMSRPLPHCHPHDVVALFEKAFHPPSEERLFGYGALEIVLELLLCALLVVTPSISYALGSALMFIMKRLVIHLHIQHLLSQLAVFVIFDFRLVIWEFLLLLNPVIRFSIMSEAPLVHTFSQFRVLQVLAKVLVRPRRRALRQLLLLLR